MESTVDGQAVQYSLNAISISDTDVSTGVTIEVSPISVEVIGFLAVARDPNGINSWYLLLLHVN